jgi:hypothetical protein
MHALGISYFFFFRVKKSEMASGKQPMMETCTTPAPPSPNQSSRPMAARHHFDQD